LFFFVIHFNAMVALLQVEVEALEEEIRVLQKLHARQWGIPTFPASASMTESTSVGKTPQPTQPTSMPLLRYDLLDQGLQRQVEACFESYAQF